MVMTSDRETDGENAAAKITRLESVGISWNQSNTILGIMPRRMSMNSLIAMNPMNANMTQKMTEMMTSHAT
jgi:hypothetical protein